MNSFTALVVLLTVAAVSQAGIEEEKAKAIEHLTKCKEETGAKEDVEELIKTREIPATHEGKIKDDRVDVEVVGKFIEKHFKDDKEKLEQAAKVLAKCALIDVKGLDKCESAIAYVRCGKENGLVV